MIEHLLRLGVTAVELQPVHSFIQDHHLVEKGLRNYWGYNSIGYFSPHSAYAASDDPVSEFKAMVRALHEAGIEVILDVVYNHTAEGNHLGPTLGLRGLDNAEYYRLEPDDSALLPGLHRHRQHPRHAPAPHAAAGDGSACGTG